MLDGKSLTAAEYVSLSEIGAGLTLGAPPILTAHLSKLLRLKFISGAMGNFRVTAIGMFRIASGS